MAMRVTFIIGNGLDLSLGLKTSYRDFYKHVKANRLIRGNRIYEKIAEDPETWTDFEASLGAYTAYIEDFPEGERQAESIAFHDELEAIRNDLADYLDSQEQSIEDLPDKFLLTATESGFFQDLNSGQRARIETMLQAIPVYVNFVTLNYTSTLEKIISGEVLLNSRGYRLTNPLHLHGDINTYLTLGVNDDSQLYSGMSDQEKKDLIKTQLIASANDGRIEAFRRILASSSLVVLFGTSLGPTDAYIWQELIDWLAQQSDRHILIHKHDSKYTAAARRSIRVENGFINKTQEQLLQHSTIDDSRKESLKRRIFVIHNTDRLFVARK